MRKPLGGLTTFELGMKILLQLLGLLVLAGGCVAEEAPSSFSISLVRPAMSCADARSLSLADLAVAEREPLVTSSALKDYTWDSHMFHVDENSLPHEWQSLFTVAGRVFLVMVEGEPIYAGALVSTFSSFSCFLPVVAMPRWSHTPETETGDSVTLEISLGYPTSDYFEGADPRSDTRILNALRDAGKILRAQNGKTEAFHE